MYARETNNLMLSYPCYSANGGQANVQSPVVGLKKHGVGSGAVAG